MLPGGVAVRHLAAPAITCGRNRPRIRRVPSPGAESAGATGKNTRAEDYLLDTLRQK
jgi:hypothetical protein